MKTVYLIRHAAYANPNNILPGRLPLPLSEEGVKQAENLATHLEQFTFDNIYSSQVLRAQQTAEIIQKKQSGNPAIKFDKRILETQSAYQGYWDANMFEGGVHFFAHINELGGENLEDIQERVVSFWNDKIVNGSENIIAVVSHDFCLLTLLKYLKNAPLPPSNQFNENDPDYLVKTGVCEVKLDTDPIDKTSTIEIKNITSL